MEELPIKLGLNIPGFVTQIVTFIILLVLLRVVAYKPVMKMLDERSRRVKESLEQAEAVREQSARAEEQLKKQMEEVGRETQDRIARAVKAGEEVKQRAQEDAPDGGPQLQAGHNPRTTEEQRNRKSRLVDEVAVEFLPVLPKALPVVGSDDQKRLVAHPQTGQGGVQPADQFVGPRHFPVIRPIGVA